ncbi:MAG: methyltransferase domain-containing protein [Sphingorhabdus sp.]|uniref:class I SAM-dependent methyltransferase n=1 Tax=Sphingorhabdus sp. TaxID=1902408 RepID=UPI003CA24C5C
MRKWILIAALVVTPITLAAKAQPNWLAIEGRAEADIKQDEGRKPVETLQALGLKKGMKVLDYMAGGGYYAEIMAKAVGPKGKVTAWNPEAFVSSDKAKEKWVALSTRTPNLAHNNAAFDGFEAPAKSYDFALFHLVYHDLYWQSEKFNVPKTDPDAVLKKLYAAMKPGGIVGVVDHVGGKGDTRETVDKTHRIDHEVVKADFARAGFKLVSESQHLRMPNDDYAKSVFDPALRGKTDRFVFKFKKPK